MICQNTYAKRTLLLVLLFCCVSLCLAPTQCSAQTMYLVSEEELTELGEIFNQQGNTTSQQLEIWKEQNKQLQNSRKLTEDLRTQVLGYQKLTADLTNSHNSISKELTATQLAISEANKSLDKLEKEDQLALNKAKLENTVLKVVVVGLAYKYIQDRK